MKTRGPDSRAVARTARIKSLLAESPKGILELAEAIYVDQRMTRIYINRLRAEPRQVYIHDWGKKGPNGRVVYPIFGLGDKRDKKKPTPLTKQETQARHVKKRDADPLRRIEHLNKRRMKLIKPRRDDFASIFVPKENAMKEVK